MSRGPSTFRQRDLKAAIKAARQAGCQVVKVEVDKEGKIVVWTSGEPARESEPEVDPFLAGLNGQDRV